VSAEKIQLLLNIGNVFVFYGAAVYWSFCIGYTILSKWWKHESGAHLFTFSLAMAIVLTYVSWRIIWPADSIEAVDLYIRAGIFATEAILATWRLSILARSQYRAYRVERAAYVREMEERRGSSSPR
jgi:hypothetical protein